MESKVITVTVVTGFENEMLAYLTGKEQFGQVTMSINNELSELAIIRAAEAGVRGCIQDPTEQIVLRCLI